VEIAYSRAREKSVQKNNTPIERTVENKDYYIITAYCPCQKCCGKTDGITASGEKAVQGVTIATDKSIPFGTKIYIDGVGERIVQDRGGAIKGNRIDLYFNDHQSALEFGRQTKEVTILN
jgi:3D (Asp-Asp-Asp) domain-containing protein